MSSETPYCVMITAHRDLTDSDQKLIKEVIAKEIADPKVDVIYFGGAVGGDSVALEAALDARNFSSARQYGPKLIVVLPKTAKDQRSDLRELTSKADEIVELKLSRKVYADIWWEHDKWMVNNSQKCIAFWDGIEAGGTYNAMKYAEKQAKVIQHIKVIGRTQCPTT